MTEDLNSHAKGIDALSHLIGSKDEDVRFLPDLFKTSEKLPDPDDDPAGHISNRHRMDALGPPDADDLTSKSMAAQMHARLHAGDMDAMFGPPDHTHTSGIEKDARRRFTEREKLALIEEDGDASNGHKIDTKGTHYENQSATDIALTMLPLLGL